MCVCACMLYGMQPYGERVVRHWSLRSPASTWECLVQVLGTQLLTRLPSGACTLTGRRWRLHYVGPRADTETWIESRLVLSAWPSPRHGGSWEVEQEDPRRSLNLSTPHQACKNVLHQNTASFHFSVNFLVHLVFPFLVGTLERHWLLSQVKFILAFQHNLSRPQCRHLEESASLFVSSLT